MYFIEYILLASGNVFLDMCRITAVEILIPGGNIITWMDY